VTQQQLSLEVAKPQVRPICNHCYADWKDGHQCPTSCGRWGQGEDKCIKDFDHIGPCEDAKGQTTLTKTAAWLGRTK
jgi:hypothetical protein